MAGPGAELDGETLNQLREIDDLNKGAQDSLQEFKGKSQGIYSLPTTSAVLPVVPNEEKYEGMWRQAMQEPLPLYFNPDGTRANALVRSRDTSPRASFIDENPFLQQAASSPQEQAQAVKASTRPSMVSSSNELTMTNLNRPLEAAVNSAHEVADHI